ncbi:MAG: biotin-dependent carboxyltransferase family protein, partial [Rhodospirillaceae bacterium]
PAVRVALVGTETPLEVLDPEPRLVPAGQSLTLTQGSRFRIGPIQDSAVCVLAVAGGIDVPEVFGSRSTYVRGGMGGLDGRPLRRGDLLPLAQANPPPGPEHCLAAPQNLRPIQTLRVVLGPQADYFSDAGLQTFFSEPYQVTREVDRMGMRLDGPTITHAKGFNIPSDGIVTGAIQVPGSGQPIILLADRQTTGGYPKIGCVVSADLPALGRLNPGAVVRFKAVSAAEAIQFRRDQEQALAAQISAIQPVQSHSLEEALWTENLISGGEWLQDFQSDFKPPGSGAFPRP